MSLKLPPGVRVEILGLIGAVQFTLSPATQLLWCDGAWSLVGNGRPMPAPGVPVASTIKEARAVGTAWITENWSPE